MKEMNIRKYGRVIKKFLRPFVAKLETVGNPTLREFWMTILDATERSLQGIMFHSPEGIQLNTGIGEDNIRLWFKKVPLCFIAWTYYSYPKENRDDFQGYLYFRNDTCGGEIVDIYENLFGERPKCNDIVKYAAGLKEDDEKGISAGGEWKASMEFTLRDYEVIGRELLEEIWGIDTAGVTTYKDMELNKDTIAKMILFVGGRLWQAHQQIIQPTLNF